MAECRLCPRACGVDRSRGERGFCRAPAMPVVARAARHDWEEPCISGSRGSGTIFFSGCNLGCITCQNREITSEIRGTELSGAALRELFQRLAEEGVHNLNLVTGTPYADVIAQALEEKPAIPVIWNSSGYESIETLRMLEGKIDVWLPDMKYANARLAAKLSMAPDYFPVAAAAIREMVRQSGPAVFDEAGMLVRGTVVRHLILPGELANSKDVLEWFSDSYPGGSVLFSLMAQYTPNGAGGPARTLTEEELQEVEDYMTILGIREGYAQDLSSADNAYLPPFDGTGVK